MGGLTPQHFCVFFFGGGGAQPPFPAAPPPMNEESCIGQIDRRSFFSFLCKGVILIRSLMRACSKTSKSLFQTPKQTKIVFIAKS